MSIFSGLMLRNITGQTVEYRYYWKSLTVPWTNLTRQQAADSVHTTTRTWKDLPWYVANFWCVDGWMEGAWEGVCFKKTIIHTDCCCLLHSKCKNSSAGYRKLFNYSLVSNQWLLVPSYPKLSWVHLNSDISFSGYLWKLHKTHYTIMSFWKCKALVTVNFGKLYGPVRCKPSCSRCNICALQVSDYPGGVAIIHGGFSRLVNIVYLLYIIIMRKKAGQ